LTVKLTGKQEIGFPDGVRAYEATTILEKELSLVPDDQDSLHLERGEHTFAFTMTVPSNTPSYERCQYGKTRFYFTAKAKGLSALGGDLLSAEKPIYLICNVSTATLSVRLIAPVVHLLTRLCSVSQPGGAGEPEPPPPLSLKYEAFSNDLGVSKPVCVPVKLSFRHSSGNSDLCLISNRSPTRSASRLASPWSAASSCSAWPSSFPQPAS
jgi:hypothetical protein